MKKRTLSLMLALMMLLTLVPASLGFAEEDIVTLQVFSMQSNTSGLQDNSYWAEILRRDLGIQIELMPAGDQAAISWTATWSPAICPTSSFSRTTTSM